MVLKPIIGINKYTILVTSHKELTDDASIDFGIMFMTPLSIKTLEQDLPFYSTIGAQEQKTFEIFVDNDQGDIYITKSVHKTFV